MLVWVKNAVIFLSVWGIVGPVWGQLCDAFESFWGQFSINLGSNWDQFESGPKFVPACVRGYAKTRPRIFLRILVHLCSNIVLVWVNNV